MGMTIFIKAIVVILFLFIFAALGSALFYLIRNGGNSDRIVKALSWRIGLSLLLFILLFLAYAMGWLHPHPVGF